MPPEWDELMAEAAERGYEVLLVEWVECADAPGLLGMADGAIIYGTKKIRIRESLSPERKVEVLEHELTHARDPEADIEGDITWELTRTGQRRKEAI